MTKDKPMIPVSKIKVGDNHRGLCRDGIAELAASIKGSGLLQPIGLRRHGVGYTLVWGERRLAAMNELGLVEIPDSWCVMVGVDVPDDELRVIENLHRRELTLDEELGAIEKLLKTGRPLDTIAAHIGHSAQWVARRANLRNLSKKLRPFIGAKEWWCERLGLGHWEEIASYPQSVQDNMDLNWVAAWARGSLKTFTSKVRECYALRLATCGWPLDELFGGSICAECPKRSSQRDVLFADIASDDDRCLDAECFNTKRGEVLKQRAKAAAKDGAVLLVSTENCWELGFNPCGLDKVASKGEYVPASKKNGAIAMYVDGPRAGETLYVKKIVPKSSNGGAQHKTLPKTEKDKAAHLEQLRGRVVVERIIELLRIGTNKPKIEDIKLFKEHWPKHAECPHMVVLLLLTGAFGAERGSETGYVQFKDLPKYYAENTTASPRVAWPGIAGRVMKELRNLTWSGRPSPQDMEGVLLVAQQIGMDVAKLQQYARERKPTPKTWATADAKK